MPRPAVAQATQDADFTLEDEAIATLAEQLLSGCWCVSVPGLPGQPLAAVSPALEQLAGHAAADLVGSSSSKLQQALRLEQQVADELATARAAGASALVELAASTKSGMKRNFAVCLVPVSIGADVLLLEFWLDLDEQRADAASVSQPKKLAAQVRRIAPAAVVLDTSQQGTASIAACSAGAYSLTGYSQPDLSGCGVQCLAGPGTSNTSMRHLMAAQSSGSHASMKMLLYKRDGSPFWSMAATCPLAVWKHSTTSTKLEAASLQQQQPQGGSSSGWERSSGSGAITQQLLLLMDITSSTAKRLGKYTLGRVLGAGASGLVRIGKNTATDELVAVKAVDATRFCSIGEIQQVQEEMAVLAQMRHPNIIRLHEVVFVGGCFYFVMEYASGGSLAGYLARQPGGRLSEAAAKHVFGSILAGLEYCHKRRVVHRDLKPENILMQGGTPKIADFGLAGVAAPFNDSGFRLQCGTPEFTAPEVVAGAEYDGTAVDLWSVGVMLYEALSGQLPFRGSSQPALFRSIRRGAYAPLSKSISPVARDLVKRLLCVDPAARITWEQLSRHPWLARHEAQQQDNTNSSSGAPCSTSNCNSSSSSSGDAACDGFTIGNDGQDGAGSAAGQSNSRHADELGSWDGSCVAADGSTAQAAAAGSCSGAGEACRWSLQPQCHQAGVQAVGAEGCAMPLPHRSALSFTSASCHESVRVVLAESSTDDPIAAAIKRLAGGVSSLQPTEDAKHSQRGQAPACAAGKSSSSLGLSSCGLSSPGPASPARGQKLGVTHNS